MNSKSTDTTKKEKKPFYKKWWFWLLALIVVGGIFGSDSEEPTEETESKKTENVDKQSEEAAKKEDTQKVEAKKEETPQTLDKKVETVVKKQFGKDKIELINYVEEDGFVLVKVHGSDNLTTNMIKTGMYLDVKNTLEALQKEKDLQKIDFNILFPMVDQYGNSTDEIVMKFSFSKVTIDKINFDNFLTENLPNVADSYWIHPAFNK